MCAQIKITSCFNKMFLAEWIELVRGQEFFMILSRNVNKPDDTSYIKKNWICHFLVEEKWLNFNQ